MLVLGGDAEQAVHNMALLEKVALDYLLALLTDGRAEKVPLPIREVAFSKLRKDEKKLAAQVEEAKAAREAAAARAREEARAAEAVEQARAAAGEPAPGAPAPALEKAGEAPPAGPSGAQLAGYSISRYPDVPAVYERLNALVEQPLRPLRRDVMDGVLSWYDENCRRSKDLTDAAAELIPGGVQHNLAFNYPFPLVVERRRGRVPLGRGRQPVHRLPPGGRAHDPGRQRPRGARPGHRRAEPSAAPSTGLFHEFELLLAKEVSRHVPSVEMFRMLGSGTEACHGGHPRRALATGKK